MLDQAVIDREIARAAQLLNSQLIPYKNYTSNPKYKQVRTISMARDRHERNIDWIAKAYKDVCLEYGYIPIEVVYDKYSEPKICIFCTLLQGQQDNIKKRYFAVLVINH